jgi:hypothetical protein
MVPTHSVVGAALVAVVALLGCAAPPNAPPADTRSTTLLCVMSAAANVGGGSSYSGTCQVPCPVNALAVNFDGIDTTRACTAEPRIVNASLAPTSVPERWLGAMPGVQPEDPTRFEVVPHKALGGAVARTPFGWFRVVHLQATHRALSLVIDTRQQVRPSKDDLAIIDRAVALIPSPAQWNKNDNRQCAPAAPTLSLFCALMQATTEISGGVHYRQPAMQAVREELNGVDPARIKTHRIMDYNNHPATTLAEVHALLQRARARVEREVR